MGEVSSDHPADVSKPSSPGGFRPEHTLQSGAEPGSWDLAPAAPELEEMRHALTGAGIRIFPYPFASALALTSDIDLSCTRNFEGYVGQLVRQHGLDFGDSVWMQTNKTHGNAGLAFLSWNFSFWNRRTSLGAGEFDHHDLVNEYHLGNVDHWHCFMVRGPRFVRLSTGLSRDGKRLVVRLPRRKERHRRHPYYGIQQLQVAAIGLIHSGPSTPIIEKVVLKGRPRLLKRTWSYQGQQIGVGGLPDGFANQNANGLEMSVGTLAGGIDEDRELPRIEYVDDIEINLGGGTADSVKEIIIFNTYGELLLSRALELQRRLNVWMNLLTIHGEWMIPQSRTYRRQAEDFAKKVGNERPEKLESLYGAGVINGFKFSTVADDPHSFARLYPELLESCGIRFWRPTGNGDLIRGLSTKKATHYCGMLDLVIPAVRRDGGGVYFLTTTKARVRRLIGDPNHDKKTTARNFHERLTVILDDFREQSEAVAVMYTHLGNLTPDNRIRDPYFPEDLFRRLRGLCHGIGYRDRQGPRLWFTRASVIADYALLLRQMAEHVERPDGNTVQIRRWKDNFLGATLPRNAMQMYGITFYVDDPLRARVFLDSDELTELVRSPADESGRGSVTIAECGIGRVVLGGLDPSETASLEAPAVGKLAASDYLLDGEESYLSVSARAASGKRDPRSREEEDLHGIGIVRPGFRADGAQQLRVTLRRGTAGSRVGLLLRTAQGGRFFFGDESLRAAVGTPTASYTHVFTGVGSETWSTLVIPFYDLAWHVEVGHDPLEVALPSRDVVAVDVLVAGGETASVDVSAIVLGRPRTVGPGGERRVVIGGRVEGARGGVAVRLRRVDGFGELEARAETDDLGGFVFSQMPPGGYEVWSSDAGRRRKVECLYDRYDLRLRAG